MITIKFDDLTVVGVRKKEYEGKTYYFASFFDNGFTNSVSCSEEFYNKNVPLLKKEPIKLHGQLAEIRFYQGSPKLRLI